MNETPISHAATVVLVRDAEPQYEIFMLRRTSKAVFASGMYVFPGGRIDDADGSTQAAACLGPLQEHQQAQREALGDSWRACWIAAIRETFEEAGFLLARDSKGKVPTFAVDDPAYTDARMAMQNGELGIAEFCQSQALTLAPEDIHFYNRWVTPPGRPRRFDTRFFITKAPSGQEPAHDGEETTASAWVSPSEALAQHEAGEFEMMAVTVKQLQDFNRFTSAEDFMEMASNNRDFPLYRPTIPAKPPT